MTKSRRVRLLFSNHNTSSLLVPARSYFLSFKRQCLEIEDNKHNKHRFHKAAKLYIKNLGVWLEGQHRTVYRHKRGAAISGIMLPLPVNGKTIFSCF